MTGDSCPYTSKFDCLYFNVKGPSLPSLTSYMLMYSDPAGLDQGAVQGAAAADRGDGRGEPDAGHGGAAAQVHARPGGA